MNSNHYQEEDHPTIRILFYLGVLTISFGCLVGSFSDNGVVNSLLFVSMLILAIIIYSYTSNFKIFDIHANDKKLRILSVFAFMYAVFGCLPVLVTLFGIPWLIKGIKKDLN